MKRIKLLRKKTKKPVDVYPKKSKKREKKLDKKQEDPEDLCYLQADLDKSSRPVSDPNKWFEVVKTQEDLFKCSTRGVLKIIYSTDLKTETFIKVKKNDVIFMLTKELMKMYFLSDDENEIFQKMYESKIITE